MFRYQPFICLLFILQLSTYICSILSDVPWETYELKLSVIIHTRPAEIQGLKTNAILSGEGVPCFILSWEGNGSWLLQREGNLFEEWTMVCYLWYKRCPHNHMCILAAIIWLSVVRQKWERNGQRERVMVILYKLKKL